jgi:uncharacterized membrane protein YeaQ/YmgE (transglycosylase-associated protein family)
MGVLWTIIIGFIAGVIAKFIMPGDNEPSGFIMTTILGIVGAFVASYLGRALAGTARVKAQDLLERSSGRSSSCSCMASLRADERLERHSWQAMSHRGNIAAVDTAAAPSLCLGWG